MPNDFVFVYGRSINRRHIAYVEWTGDVDSAHGVYPHKATVVLSIAPYSGAGRVGSLEMEGDGVTTLWQFIHGKDSR